MSDEIKEVKPKKKVNKNEKIKIKLNDTTLVKTIEQFESRYKARGWEKVK